MHRVDGVLGALTRERLSWLLCQGGPAAAAEEYALEGEVEIGKTTVAVATQSMQAPMEHVGRKEGEITWLQAAMDTTRQDGSEHAPRLDVATIRHLRDEVDVLQVEKNHASDALQKSQKWQELAAEEGLWQADVASAAWAARASASSIARSESGTHIREPSPSSSVSTELSTAVLSLRGAKV